MGLTWLYSCDPPSQARARVLSTASAVCPALCWVLANHRLWGQQRTNMIKWME